MIWPRRKLESLAVDEPYSFVGGPFGSRLTSRDYIDEGVPVIRESNLNNGRFLTMDDFVIVSDSKVHEELSGNLAKPGDIIFTQRGTLGQVPTTCSHAKGSQRAQRAHDLERHHKGLKGLTTKESIGP